ncbi:MAG: lipid asymmetry maintenance ABC transporter permease subunit MlaE [Neisseriaceae bacterium]|nr:lipid asymmetry maintenance ABC transporter permease subunit MlaE [Neisseriaceae bacterium]
MIQFLAKLGQYTEQMISRLGFSARFLLAILRHSGLTFLRPRLLTRQIYDAGVLSLIIIAVSGVFVGLVMGLQIYNTLAVYGSTEMTGALVTLIVLRELGPVLAGIFFASRAGSSITAEIGLMKATEQLDAMAVMAVNPMARVVSPRFWAGLISLPILTALFNVMAIFGSYVICVRLIHMDEGIFWGQIKVAADFRYDVLNSLIKSLVFGVAVTLIAVIEGYDATPTAQGVSTATTRTVVISALTILALDFVMTAFMF